MHKHTWEICALKHLKVGKWKQTGSKVVGKKREKLGQAKDTAL